MDLPECGLSFLVCFTLNSSFNHKFTPYLQLRFLHHNIHISLTDLRILLSLPPSLPPSHSASLPTSPSLPLSLSSSLPPLSLSLLLTSSSPPLPPPPSLSLPLSLLPPIYLLSLSLSSLPPSFPSEQICLLHWTLLQSHVPLCCGGFPGGPAPCHLLSSPASCVPDGGTLSHGPPLPGCPGLLCASAG